jgi:hypothetical protein
MRAWPPGGRGQDDAALLAGWVGEISALGIVRAGGRRARRDTHAHAHAGTHHGAVDTDIWATTADSDTRPATTATAAAPLGESLGRQPHSNQENGSNGSNGSI